MFNAAMLIGALLLCAPWAMAQGGATTDVTLTVKIADGITPALTATPATVTVKSGAKAEFKLNRKAGDGKEFKFEGATVTPKNQDGVTFEVVVTKNVTVTVSEEVKGGAATDVTLTVKIADGITPALTATPATVTVKSGAKAEFKLNRKAGDGKEFKFEGATVTPKGQDGMTFEVTVTADVTVTITEVAKTAPQPEAPNFDITTMINGATVVVKEGTTELNQEALKTIEAGKMLTITVTVPPTKELVKVEIKKGEDLKALTAETDGSYKYTTTIDKVTLVVTTKEKEAPAAGTELVIVNGGAQVKVMKKGATKPLTDAELKNIAKETELEITFTTYPKKLAIEKVEVKEYGAQKATVLTAKAGKYSYKMTDKKTTLTVITKKVTPVEDAVLAAVAVYPNPFAGELVVANTTEVAKVALVNAQGVVVRTVLPNGANELRLAVEDLPAGVYVLVLERADARKAIRLVK